MTIPIILLGKQEIIYRLFENELYKEHFSTDETLVLGNMAWDFGRVQAKKFNNKSIRDLIKESCITLNIIDTNYESLTRNKKHYSSQIAFSDYNYLSNTITVFVRNIEKNLLPSIPIEYNNYRNLDFMVDLSICHEFFHFLEHTSLSRSYTETSIHFFYGIIKLTKRITTLSEIAAHSFVKKFKNLF